MRPNIVRTIYLKEIRETLRDKRTLFLMIFLPVLLYPILMLVVTQVAVVQMGRMKARTGYLAILGGQLPQGLRQRIVADKSLQITSLSGDATQAIRQRRLQAVLRLPKDGDARLDRNRNLDVEILFDQANDHSKSVRARLRLHLDAFRQEALFQRLRQRGLTEEDIRPVTATYTNVAPPRKTGGYILAQFLPMLIILTVIMGAFYPAIDLTAGEKERGTLQTLLTAPLSSAEIVSGKYLAVVTIAFVSGFFNVLSLGLVFSHNLFLSGVDLKISVSLPVMALLLLIIVVMGLFFSALMITVAVLAKSFKEAQHYLTPVYLLCLIPVMITQLPGMQLDSVLAMVPAINLSLLLKGLLVGEVSAQGMFTVLISTGFYTVLILLVAARLFDQQRLLLGEAGQWRTLFQLKPSERRDALNPTEGIFFLALLFLLFFYLGGLLQKRDLVGGLLISQWGLLCAPTVAYLLWQRIDLRNSLALAAPSPRVAISALALGISAWAIILTYMQLQNQFLPLPTTGLPSLEKLFRGGETTFGLIKVLLVVAVTPAICEELVFRGLLMSAFRSRVSDSKAIVYTALLFGLFHMSVHRFVPTFFLGLLLGIVLVRGGSIALTILFHVLHNGVVSLLTLRGQSWLSWDMSANPAPPVPLFLAASAVFAFGLWWLLPRVKRNNGTAGDG